MPWPRLKMKARAEKCETISATRRSSAGPPARKTNHRHRRMALLEPTHQATRWLDDPMAKLIVGQIARPAIENLHEIGTGIDLSAEIFNRDVLEKADQPFKALRISIGPQPRVRLIDTALSSHHVGCHRPGRTAEPDERRCPRKILAHPRNGLEHALELGPSRARVQASKFGRGADRIKPRALAFDKVHGLIERVGHDKDIGKHDGSVEIEATDRLQGHFGSELWRIAQLQEVARSGPDRTILRQVAPGLPHQPNRRRDQCLPGKDPQHPTLVLRSAMRHRRAPILKSLE